MNVATNDILETAGIFDESLEIQIADALAKLPRELLMHQPGVMLPGVAVRLLSLLTPQKDAAFLTIGIENGFTQALLSLLGVRCFSVESDGMKAQQVRKLLDKHPGLSSSLTKVGPIQNGWDEYQPYDGILILGVPTKIEASLFAQLSMKHGRLACLVGDDFSQTVTVWEKHFAKIKKVEFELLQGYES
jgi:protein-L-isoaspartate O-methyltransferase